MPTLIDLTFEDAFVRAMPGDSDRRNVSRQTPGVSYSPVDPTPVAAPSLLAWSDAAGDLLGVTRPALGPGPVADVLAGNRLLPGMRPYAARYGGHQFGHWADQLGDGRAITLGEVRGASGQVLELQLKGAGPTPYSRRADGRAVLRSSVREFLCSEAMHALGVPTTRALSLVATGDTVVRDMFYDGRAAPEPSAIVCRIAPSFVRFGHFELHAVHGEIDVLRRLADLVIATHYPALSASGADRYLEFFEDVCRRTAVLVAHWMRVGFVHGVLNTDNMSILGVTIDYGPYGWLENYDPGWTPNTTDAGGRRYRFGHQPNIALWNLARLGEALGLLLDSPTALQSGLTVYRDTFQSAYGQMLGDKLGLDAIDVDGDDPLLVELFDLLEGAETDVTLFFRGLAAVPVDGEWHADLADRWLAPLRAAFYEEASSLRGPHRARVLAWLRQYASRVRAEAADHASRISRMRRANPKYVLRNYLAQQAIDAAMHGDVAPIARLLRVLSRPYDDQPADDELAARRPEWARHRAGCSMLSCSS